MGRLSRDKDDTIKYAYTVLNLGVLELTQLCGDDDSLESVQLTVF